MSKTSKGFKKNIDITKNSVGVGRRQELLDNINNEGTFLPKGVGYEDIDSAFVDFIGSELTLTLENEKVPVIFLTIQRWSEFTKTWQHSDKYKNVKLPFITIVRKPDVQVGTNQRTLYNVPTSDGYRYIKVPTLNNGRKGIDIYKIPQPTSVDITYEVKIFTNRINEINTVNSKIQKQFNSRQSYIFPNEHPMPVHLEMVSDESQVDSIDSRKFYIQTFEMVTLGYILDSDDFKIIPSVDRTILTEVIDGVVSKHNPKSEIIYEFKYRANSFNTFGVVSKFEFMVTNINIVNNIKSYEILLNNNIVTPPFFVGVRDKIVINIIRDNDSLDSLIILNGNK